ncbi:uncharacterized protein [Chironomus tepperi]|uniref:uncharacterized protein n=1 Tax=Chironomus tepperi TaxID=113505 RepID=UPI00391FA5A1
MADIKEIKAQIRSVLLSLGKTATEQEFKKAYYEIEGTSFNEVLRKLNINFKDLFLRIPDVAKIVYAYNQVFIQRVSNEATAHMENLTVNKYSKNFRGPKLVAKNGAIKGRPMLSQFSVKAPVYSPYPMQTAPLKKVVPFQPNRSYGYQTPVQNNFNMKVSVGTNNSRDVQCYYSNNNTRTSYNKPSTSNTSTKYYENNNNAGTSYNKPSVSSAISNNSNQPSNFADISNTSTKKDLSTQVTVKANEMPQTSLTAGNLDTLSKTSRMPQPPPSDISSISTTVDSESTRIDEDFDEVNTMDDKTSVKSESKTHQRVLTESPRIAPMASTTKPTLKPNIMSLLRSNKQEEAKDLSKVETLADKVGTLKLNETENGAQNINPVMIRQRLRSMRIFREALNTINLNQENGSQDTESLIGTNEIIILPEPIQNEEELFFFVKIIDVASPGKFVFQFSFARLKDLSNKMNDFYNNLKDLKKYETKNLVNDNIVAVRYNDLWYRGQIKSFNETEACVQLVDSMKIQPRKVSIKNIFHLHQKFTTESPKSAFGKLYGLKPIEGDWGMRSTAKVDAIHEKMVLATVKSIDNGIYSLSIITETGKFTRLSDIFVEENLAELEPEDFATEAVFRSLV